jgi:putative ABC transport system permease protein
MKTPGFTAVALLTLALGIGATSVTFSLVHAVLLRPFPVAHPEQLIALNEANVRRNFSSDLSISYTNFCDWRREQRTLASLAIYEDAAFTLADTSAAEHLDGAIVSAEYFETLGVPLALGRGFTRAEESPTGARVVVLSHDLWVNRFHSDPAILGQPLRLDGLPHTIVGVMSAGFRFPDNAALWTPIRDYATDENRGSHSYDGVARLAPGVTVEQSRSDLDAIAARLSREHPATNANVSVVARPFLESVTASFRRVVLTLFGAVACLLAITCVNLAGLQLARGAAREREIAVRLALGATRIRIVRELLIENVILGLAGGLLGTLAAAWTLDLLARSLVDTLPWWMNLSVDRPVLMFTLGVTVLTSLGFGLAPSWMLSGAPIGEALKQGGRSGSARSTPAMRVLAGAQLTLALVLLTGAGLLVKNFLHLRDVRPGFDAGGVLTFSLPLPEASYPDDARKIDVNVRLVAELQSLPGVDSAAVVSNLPLGGSNWGRGFTLADRPAPPLGQTPVALNRVVSADYFRAMHIPLVQGRIFTAADSASAPRVALIDEAFAREFFPHQNPLGQRLHYGRADRPNPGWMEIVGVIGNVRHYDLQNSKNGPGLYVPATQHSPSASAFYVLRTTRPPASLAAEVRAAVARVDRELAPAQIRPMTEWVDDATWRDRFVGELFTGFAGMALLLSALGVYGVTAFATGLRTREIGVRMALGAQPADVLRLILGGAARLTAIALALGLVGSFALSQLLASQLYEVSPRDPTVFVSVLLTLLVATLAACWLPARRATRVNPTVALRAE